VPNDESPPSGIGTGRHVLGPHVVGQRVVIRRVLRGETGPSGGPAMTDVLGVCTWWADGRVVVRTEAGELVEVATADIVSGKPVPARASIRDRVSAQEAQVRSLAMWPDLVTEPLGAWVLRSSATASARRANSVLAMTDAAVDSAVDVVDAVVAHYRSLGQRPIAAVLPGSPEEALFLDRGWVPESNDGNTVFEIASVAHLRRGLRALPRHDVTLVEDGDLVTATIGGPAEPQASGVATYADDWVGFRTIETRPDHRRRGLALDVMSALIGWGAERGARTAYLQVLDFNEPALALYARLGFRPHHEYRYLAEPV
jgi:GNAT superfamily N-acetyltransferase